MILGSGACEGCIENGREERQRKMSLMVKDVMSLMASSRRQED